MNAILVVLFKELRDSLRDRRTVLNALLIGPVLGPVLFVVLFGVMTSKELEKAEEVLRLPVVGAEHAPSLVGFLRQQGVVVLPAPEDAEAAVRAETHAVVLRIDASYPERWRRGEPARVELLADRSRRETGTTVSRVRRLVDAYSRQTGQLRLMLRGIDPNVTTAVQVVEIDLSTPESRGAMVLAMLPYFVMMGLFVSGMSVAIDSTAGEKERRTLEPLLINPLPRWQLVAGKLLAATTFTLISLALSLLAFMIGIGFIPAEGLNLRLNLDPAMAVHIWLLTAPVGFLAAGLLVVLASFARSFREAQSYMGLVVLVPMLPTLWMFINPLKPALWMMTVPLLSQSVLIVELMRGNPVTLDYSLLSIGSSVIAGLLFAALAAALYARPRILAD